MGLLLTKLSSWLCPYKEIRILLLGLDGVGKTTILHKLMMGEPVTTTPIPIAGFKIETVSCSKTSFSSWDIAYQDTIRPFLQRHIRNTAAVVFVVDSTDRHRVAEARDQLQRMMDEEALRDAVLLVFANKGDMGNGMSVDEIIDELELHSFPQSHCCIQSSCATSGEGLYEGLNWLIDKLKVRGIIRAGPDILEALG